jgi:hypothetical protein
MTLIWGHNKLTYSTLHIQGRKAGVEIQMNTKVTLWETLRDIPKQNMLSRYRKLMRVT